MFVKANNNRICKLAFDAFGGVMENKPYIDMRELADLLCLSYNTVRTYHSKKSALIPPACKKAGRPLWKRSDVMDWVENRTQAM